MGSGSYLGWCCDCDDASGDHHSRGCPCSSLGREVMGVATTGVDVVGGRRKVVL